MDSLSTRATCYCARVDSLSTRATCYCARVDSLSTRATCYCARVDSLSTRATCYCARVDSLSTRATSLALGRCRKAENVFYYYNYQCNFEFTVPLTTRELEVSKNFFANYTHTAGGILSRFLY